MTKMATSTVMRNVNRAAVLKLIRKQSPIARAEIARRLKLSLPTVMRIVDDLIEEGLVSLCDLPGESTGGRPPALVEFNGKRYAVIGVDLGGQKIYGTLADLEGNIQHEIYIRRKEGLGPEAYVEQLCAVIDELVHFPRPDRQELRGIGVGVPGVTLVPEGVVTWAPSLGWRDLPLQKILRERYAYPVFVENDVNLAVLGELGFGVGRDVRDLVLLVVGMGIGAGVILDGVLYRGHNQAAGEVGYLVPGVEYLGRRYEHFGALESFASVRGIVARARRMLEEHGREVPEDLDVPTLLNMADSGDPLVGELMDEFVDDLALVVVALSAVLNPEMVVLGGEISDVADRLIERILPRVDGVVPYLPRLLASPLGLRAAVMGAIMLVLNITMESFTLRRLP